MDAKQRLRNAYFLGLDVEAKRLELERLRSLMTAIPSSGSPRSRGPGGASGRLDRLVAKCAAIEAEVEGDVGRLLGELAAIRRQIARVQDPRLRLVLQRRYLCRESWEEISSGQKIGIRWLHRLHARALQAFEGLDGR